MSTEALLALHAEGSLTDEASAALEAELTDRSVPIPARPAPSPQTPQRKLTTVWALRLSIFGALVPGLCLSSDFQAGPLQSLCTFCWPTGFMLSTADGQFNLLVYALSIGLNVLMWAAIGWIIGYGLSGGKRT